LLGGLDTYSEHLSAISSELYIGPKEKMTVEIKKDRLFQGKLQKKVFESVEEAKSYLAHDPLGCVYKSAKDVTVITMYGSGVFKKEDWDK
jgi:hypothetical protein